MKINLTAVVIALELVGALQVGRAGPIAFQTVPLGINDLGQIVGFADDQGFLDTNGVFTELYLPGTDFTIAYGINNADQIVLFDNTHSESFLYSAGQLTPINSPGASFVWAQGINNAGQIVGLYGNGTSSGVGFLDTGGVFTTIEVPGSIETEPRAVNDLGQVVGVYVTAPSTVNGFLYSGGVFTTLNVPDLADVSGINDAGQIVGSTFSGANPGGFLYSQGSYTTINPPGVTDSSLSGINNLGEMVGAISNREGFLDVNGVFTYFEAPAPSPEPGSSITLGGGLVLLMLLKRGHGAYAANVHACATLAPGHRAAKAEQ